MFQLFCSALVALFGLLPVPREGADEVVGDARGFFRRNLDGTTWVRGNPKAPDRIELSFELQGIIRSGKSMKRPAMTVAFYREGELAGFTYGPIFLEKSGKRLVKQGNRLYRYRLSSKTIRFEEYAGFETGDEPTMEEEPDPVLGIWTLKSGPPAPEFRDTLIGYLIEYLMMRLTEVTGYRAARHGY